MAALESKRGSSPRDADLRVGVVGCGQIAENVHIPVLDGLRGVSVVALCDVEPARIERVRSRASDAVAFTDHRRMLEEVELDAVVITAPSGCHAELAIDALERGKHIYLEKPMATDLAAAREVITAWRMAGSVAMMGFNYRFNRLFRRLRRELEAGRIGPLIGARTVFSLPKRELPAWRKKRETGGGVLLDLASHHIDLVRYIFRQEVAEVTAHMGTRDSEDDPACLVMRLDDGLCVQSFFSEYSVEEDAFEVYGRTGKLIADRYFLERVQRTDRGHHAARVQQLVSRLHSFLPSRQVLRKLREPAREPSYRAALASFVMAARHGSSPEVDLLDGYRSLVVIDAAEESARTGMPVSCAARSTV